MFPDSLHLHQLFRLRIQHLVKAAEMLYQSVGDGVGIHARDAVEQ